MAVAPLQLPGYQSAPDINWSPLDQLGKTIKVYRDKAALGDIMANADFSNPQSLQALATQAYGIDPSTGMTLANMASRVSDTQYQRGRDEKSDAWRQQESERAQRNADRSYGLQARSAARANEGPVEKAAQRARAAEMFGLVPGTPEHKTYVLTGALPDTSKLPAGFQADASGGLKPIPGGPADPAYLRTKGDKQNAPSGYKWIDPENPNAGMAPIPGGPGEKVDAEVAGRLGLARSFLGQFPEIRKRVEAGEITGPIDAGMAKLGMGGPGEIRRQMDSGAEALLRMLTGAGMNQEEAREYTRRYRFDPTDKSTTVVSKLNQLERELNSVGETVGKGRGGWTPPGATQAPSGNVTSSGVKWSVQ